MWLRAAEQTASPAEAMRGTTMGYPNEKHAATPAVVQRHYGHIRMAALSLAGALLLPPLNGLPNAPKALMLSSECCFDM